MHSRLGQCVFHTVTDAECVDPQQSSIPLNQILSVDNVFDECLLNAEQIFPAAAKLIENAQVSVEIITFAFEYDCDAAKCIAKALQTAQKKREQLSLDPLQVRFLIDNSICSVALKHGKYSLQMWAKECNLDPQYVDLQIAVHQHLGLDAIHCKYFIIDSTQLIVTGDNFYKHTNFNPASWYDLGFRLHGTVASQVRQDFGCYWNRSVACSVNWSALQHTVNTSVQSNNLLGIPILVLSKRESNAPMTKWNNQVIRNPVDQSILAVMYQASHSVDIISPSCNALPFQLALIHAISRRIQVRMLLTGCPQYKWRCQQNFPFQGGDNQHVLNMFCHKYRDIVDPAIRSKQLEIRYFSPDGVTYKLEGKRRNHSKLLIADNEIVICGSSNNDTQTWKHSAELNLLLDSVEVTKRIQREVFDFQWSNSIPITTFPVSEEYCVMNLLLTLSFLLITLLILWFIWKRSGKDKECVFLSFALLFTLGLIFIQSQNINTDMLMLPWPVYHHSVKK